jgi:hypothetical protein
MTKIPTEQEVHNRTVRAPNLQKHLTRIQGGLAMLDLKPESKKGSEFVRTYLWAIQQTADNDIVFDIALLRFSKAGAVIEDLKEIIKQFTANIKT